MKLEEKWFALITGSKNRKQQGNILILDFVLSLLLIIGCVE